jgi:hypothetical protein
LQPQVNAGELSLLAKQLLRRANVHHRQRRTARPYAPRHRDRVHLQATLQPQYRALRIFLRRRVQKHGVGRKQRQPVRSSERPRHQVRRHKRHHQRVDPDHAHGRAAPVWRLGVAAQFQHRAGEPDLGVTRHAGKHHLVKTAPHTAQLQVGLAVDGAHRL